MAKSTFRIASQDVEAGFKASQLACFAQSVAIVLFAVLAAYLAS